MSADHPKDPSEPHMPGLDMPSLDMPGLDLPGMGQDQPAQPDPDMPAFDLGVPDQPAAAAPQMPAAPAPAVVAPVVETVPAVAPAAAQPPAATPYRVLARKYRPQDFDDLIGQEAMVRTLSNAFASGRIAQAYILTGVRGVGKTTTARILARALNYEPMDGADSGPSLDLSVFGKHCKDIIESRHVDVMEMDAASNTSINDIREIIDGSRYRPVMARYKVYIIDEVHMLSTAAFNGLLKTLEEPPEHVKFIFATTEIRKVPVTVLSRCQRFDLRRVEAGTLAAHLSKICAKENVTVDAEALSIVSRAAEGSVRDSLSLLDQAIAHGGGTVTGEEIRRLLGLADKARVIDLFEALMKGDMPRALAEFRDQYDSGADPAVILTDLAEFTHLVTRLKIVPESAEDASLVEAERLRGKEMAAALSMRVLSRTWQMLTKGISEVQQAAKPAQAAEMVLVRLAYASDLPTPDETLRKLKDMPADSGGAPGPSAGGGGPPSGAVAMGGGGARLAIAARSEPVPQRAAPQPAAGPHLASFADVVALAVQKRDLMLKHSLEAHARLVHFEQGRIELAIAEGGDPNLVQTLSRKLIEWTGNRWLVSLSSKPGEATIAEVAKARREEREDGIRADPLVAAVLARFPGAQIVDVRTTEDVAVEALAPVEETGADAADDDDGLSPFD